MAGAVARAVDLLLPAGCVSCRAWMPRDNRRDRVPICAGCRSRLRKPSWPRCLRCHAPVGRMSVFTGGDEDTDCHECRSWPSALSFARAAYVLRGPASNLVHALKYEGWHEVAEFMAERAAESVARDSPEAPGLVTPVPTTVTRERRRGYNQAALLAKGVASVIGTRVVEVLRRTDERRSQIELEPTERRTNVRGVFTAAEAISEVRDRRVLLVDDVLTTGATACEAASVLMECGARSVSLVTFARALPEATSALS